MPNWCSNYLHITTGSREHLDQVAEKFKKTPFFANIYPTPDILHEIDKRRVLATETGNCWNTLFNTGLTNDQTASYLNCLTNGMVEVGRTEPISLDAYLEEKFSGISDVVRQLFVKEAQEITGIPVTTLTEAVMCILEACDGFVSSCDWQTKHWGTKQDVECISFEEDSATSMNASFETVWNPPIAFFRYFSKQLPKTEFELSYYDQCNNICGKMLFKNGMAIVIDADSDEIMRDLKKRKKTTVPSDKLAGNQDYAVKFCT